MQRKILTFDDFSNFVSPPLSLNGTVDWECDWLIDKALVRGAFNILGGAPKVGKSLLRSHLLVCCMAGCPALGSLETKKASRGLLLAGEESLEIEEARLRRAARGVGISASELPIQILPQTGFFFDDDRSYENFFGWVVDREFDLVVIDPLIRWHRVNENISGELSPVLTQLRRLCHAGITVLMIHHYGKPKEGADDMPEGFMLRGSSDLYAIFDHLVGLRRPKGRGNARYLRFDTRPDATPDPMDIQIDFPDEKIFTFSARKSVRDDILGVVPNIGGPEPPVSANWLVDRISRGRSKVLSTVKTLEKEGLIVRDGDGYRKAGGTKFEHET